MILMFRSFVLNSYVFHCVKVHCNCIVTRVEVYDEISPEPEEFHEGLGDVSSYTLTRVTIQSF